MKKQIILIHGGDTFGTYEEYISFLKEFEIDFERMRSNEKNWKHALGEKLGEEFEVILPSMPDKSNAKYPEWKIWFEKIIPHLDEEVVLIGHSLGGTFLAKYLSENGFPKKIIASFLIAAPFDDEDSEYSLADFSLPQDLEKLREQSDKIFLFYSKDDKIVPFSDMKKYETSLPKAETLIFEDRGHFNQPELPELIDAIKNLYKNQ